MNIKHSSRNTSSVIGSWEARSELRCDFTGEETGAGGPGAACPAPLGVPPPAGCEKTFIQDTRGSVSCQDDEDCPDSLQWWQDNGGICSQSCNLYSQCVDNR